MIRTAYKRLFPIVAIAFILVFSGQESCAKDSMFGYNSYDTHIEMEAQKRAYPHLFRFQRWCSNHKKSILCISGGIVAAALVYAGYRGQLYNKMFEYCFGSATPVPVPTPLPPETPTSTPSEAPAPSVGDSNETLDKITVNIDGIDPEIRPYIVYFLEKFRQSPGVVRSIAIDEKDEKNDAEIKFSWESAAGFCYDDTIYQGWLPIKRLLNLPDNAFLRYLLSEMQCEGRTVSLDESLVTSKIGLGGSRIIFVDFQSVVSERVPESTTSVGGSVPPLTPPVELNRARDAIDQIDPKIRTLITRYVKDQSKFHSVKNISSISWIKVSSKCLMVKSFDSDDWYKIKDLYFSNFSNEITAYDSCLADKLMLIENNGFLRYLLSEIYANGGPNMTLNGVTIERAGVEGEHVYTVKFPDRKVNPVQNIAPLPSSRSANTTQTTRTATATVSPVMMQPRSPVSSQDIKNSLKTFSQKTDESVNKCIKGETWRWILSEDSLNLRKLNFYPVIKSVQDNLTKMESLLNEPDFLSDINGFIDKFQIASDENQIRFMNEVDAMLKQNSSSPQLIQKQMAAGFACYWIFGME